MINRCQNPTCGELFEDTYELAYCASDCRLAVKNRNRPASVTRKPKPTLSTDAAWLAYAEQAKSTVRFTLPLV
jgi:hypothetical protein